MGFCRAVLAVAASNLSRLKRDVRVWFILAFTLLLLIYYIRPVVMYGLDTKETVPVHMLSMLFHSPTVSVKAPKILFHIGLLCLLCDAPFFSPSKPYLILRSRRSAWCTGECLYIICVAFLYVSFITVVSSLLVIPVCTFSDSFSGIMTDMELGTGTLRVDEISVRYPHTLFPRLVIQYLYPSGAQIYTFLSVWMSFSILGLLMYLISLLKKNAVLGLACSGVFVFLDPILVWAAWPNKFWILAFSPVCWTSVEQLDILGANHFISIPYVAVTGVLLLIILYFLIFQTAKRISLDGFATEGGFL